MKKFLTIVFQYGTSLLLGAACGVAMAIYMMPQNLSIPYVLELLTALLIMYAAIYIQTILHETGHLIFGLLTGYRFVSFRIRSWMLIRRNGKMKLARYWLGGTLGQCLLRPPEIKDGRFPVMLYNFGGVFLNLISAAVFLLWWSLAEGWLAQMLLLLLVVAGVHGALANGIPMENNLIANDGRNALKLARNAEERWGFWLSLEINARFAQGQRLIDMPEEWLKMPGDEELANPHMAALAINVCARRMEQGENAAEVIAEMKRLLGLKSAMIGIHRAQLTCDLITCLLILDDENGEVPALLDKNQKKMMNALGKLPSILRTQYAIERLLEKNEAKAAAVMKQFEKLAKNYPYPVEIESERELLKAIDEKAA